MTEDEALALLRGDDPEAAARGEAALWAMWAQVGDPGLDALLREGVGAMERQELREAESCFSRLIERAPTFAEGWNKRATVRYLAGDYEASIADCRETLARNAKHFGAASGEGLCHMSLNEFPDAAVCFRRALDIHPHLDAVRCNLALAEAEGGGSGYRN
jgi:tetratricopeptide (TPR) repeat protein